MTVKITCWHPDTCGCVMDIEWDDTEPESIRTHRFKTIISKCPEHAGLSGRDVYEQVLSENTRKNLAFSEIQTVHPQITPDNYLWFFDKERALQVSVVGVSLPETAKKGLQTAMDAKFGSGKVRLV